MTQSESITKLATALVQAQAEMPKAKKEADNPFFKSKYASLDKVLPLAIEVLSKHGLAITQHIVALDGGDSGLETMLLHESGEYLSSTMKLYIEKVNSQGQGSAVTYARRYAVQSIIGMVADTDDDGNESSPKTDSEVKYPRREDLVGAAQLGRLKGFILEAGGTIQQVEEKAGKMLGQLTVKQATDIIEQLQEKINSKTDPQELVPNEPTGEDTKELLNDLGGE